MFTLIYFQNCVTQLCTDTTQQYTRYTIPYSWWVCDSQVVDFQLPICVLIVGINVLQLLAPPKHTLACMQQVQTYSQKAVERFFWEM